uniref:Uncharacterized protein n=1 Tax=Arundo donax TaxID=35708 RepID=A0A0A9HXC3_ARUDO
MTPPAAAASSSSHPRRRPPRSLPPTASRTIRLPAARASPCTPPPQT